jgi:drug/metabolite transporter (DMT)-like permease
MFLGKARSIWYTSIKSCQLRAPLRVGAPGRSASSPEGSRSWKEMAVFFALIATLFTSFLPILNKHLLQDSRPALVALWVNAASLPVLTVGTLLSTQCSLHPATSPFLTCMIHLPQVDGTFVLALLGSALLNGGATLLSTVALSKADAALVSPLLTFNPAFTLLVALFVLGEVPGWQQTLGVAIVLFGAYLLDVESARTNLFAPVRLVVRQPGTLLALIASALWGGSTVLEKLAIDHMMPPSGPAVALLSTVLLVLSLCPPALRSRRQAEGEQHGWRGIARHPRAFVLAALLAGTAPLFGFTAMALGLVGYVTTLFKLSAVLTILWAWWFLGEGQIKSRLLGASVMIVGGLLVAT